MLYSSVASGDMAGLACYDSASVWFVSDYAMSITMSSDYARVVGVEYGTVVSIFGELTIVWLGD